MVEPLKTNPNSRRILFHGWNVEYLPDERQSPQEYARNGLQALPPCHLLYQAFVHERHLSMQLYIRSSDVFLGLPYNTAAQALQTHMLAQQCDLIPQPTPVDIAFHLASIPGGAAESDYYLGRRVNVDATLALLEGLRDQDNPARVVFASTIAVYGSPLPAQVDDQTPLRPQLSYATQKLMGELLIDDFSRRGWIDGISLRLPGIAARPPQPSGLLSAFMSDVFWKLKAGEPFDSPVSPQAMAWWMSAARCIDNLLHAATIPAECLLARRVFTLPVLHLSMAQLVDGLCKRFGEDRRWRVDYRPDEHLENNFGRYPPLLAEAAETLGLSHDGDLEQLIERTLGNRH
jgi:nucleoside-diphosphate-sugar epimerase